MCAVVLLYCDTFVVIRLPFLVLHVVHLLSCAPHTHIHSIAKKNCAQSDGIYKWVIFGGVLFLFILLANTKLIIYTRRYIYNSTVSVRLCTVFRRVPLVRRKRAKSLPLLMLILFTLFTLLCGCRCKERRAIDLCGIGCVNIKRADTPLYYFFRCVCVCCSSSLIFCLQSIWLDSFIYTILIREKAKNIEVKNFWSWNSKTMEIFLVGAINKLCPAHFLSARTHTIWSKHIMQLIITQVTNNFFSVGRNKAIPPDFRSMRTQNWQNNSTAATIFCGSSRKVLLLVAWYDMQQLYANHLPLILFFMNSSTFCVCVCAVVRRLWVAAIYKLKPKRTLFAAEIAIILSLLALISIFCSFLLLFNISGAKQWLIR